MFKIEKKGRYNYRPTVLPSPVRYFSYYTKLSAIDGAWLACANNDVDTC